MDRHLEATGQPRAVSGPGAVYHSWQLERVQQAMSARTTFNAYTAEAEQRKRDEQEVADLAFRLLHGRGGLRACGPQSESEGGQAGVTWPVAVDDADHPAVLVGRLTNLRAGCEWLIEHWIELSEMLEKGEAWEARERFIAIRLLRMDPMDALDAKPLTTLLRACQAVDPHAGDLVKELLPTTHSAATRLLPPADEAAARLELTAIAGSEIERLEAKIEEHDELAEIEAALRSRQEGFDFSRDGALMRRYETTCDNKLSRMISDFSSRKRDESRYEYTPSLGDHRKEVAETLAQASCFCCGAVRGRSVRRQRQTRRGRRGGDRVAEGEASSQAGGRKRAVSAKRTHRHGCAAAAKRTHREERDTAAKRTHGEG